MKIYDISQELFTSVVFPGDRPPRKIEEMRMSRGDIINLSYLEMCVHNGTHVDSPFHFLSDGDTIDQIPLEKTVGYCYVTEQNTDLDAQTARQILMNAQKANPDASKRILIKGKGVVTEDAARVFAQAGVYLVGVESQTVGPESGPRAVHLILLGAKTVLLEGVRLGKVGEGVYILNAAPICLGGCDGSPCRAILMKL